MKQLALKQTKQYGNSRSRTYKQSKKKALKQTKQYGNMVALLKEEDAMKSFEID